MGRSPMNDGLHSGPGWCTQAQKEGSEMKRPVFPDTTMAGALSAGGQVVNLWSPTEGGTRQSCTSLRRFEGRHVSVALRNGSRIEDCSLVSAGRNPTHSLWLFADGLDTFVALDDVVEVRELAARSQVG